MKKIYIPLLLMCFTVLNLGMVFGQSQICIPGCCNGDLKDGSGTVAGSFSDWKAYADGTTEGKWTYTTAVGDVVSNDASGTYVYNAGISTAVYTGTASFPASPQYGSSSYTLYLTLTFPEPDYCLGQWSVDFDNSQWADITDGQWEHTSTCAGPIADHVDEILIDSGIDHYFNALSVSYNFDIEIITDGTAESVTFSSPGTAGLADGITFDITKQHYHDPQKNVDAGYAYDPDSDTHEWWYFQGADAPEDLDCYGNGWYDITVHYTAGGADSTRIWFNLLGENSPIPAPAQMVNLTSHTNRQRDESPLILQWESVSDANANNLWVSTEMMPDGAGIDRTLPVTAVSTDPIILDDGYHEVGIGFEHYCHFAHNADGIAYHVGRYTEKSYLIGVGIVSELTGTAPVDMADLEILAAHWLEVDCGAVNDYCGNADVNFDDRVNFDDFAEMSKDWLK